MSIADDSSCAYIGGAAGPAETVTAATPALALCGIIVAAAIDRLTADATGANVPPGE